MAVGRTVTRMVEWRQIVQPQPSLASRQNSVLVVYLYVIFKCENYCFKLLAAASDPAVKAAWGNNGFML